MAARADFVSDYQVGQQVTVVLGNGALCWSGQLVEIGERRIRLKMDDDTVRSVSYEGIIADYLSPQVVSAQGAQAPVQENLSPIEAAYREVCDAAYEWEFDPVSLREQVRLSPNIESKRLIAALADSLAEAEATDDFETMDQIVSAGLSLLEKAPESIVLRRLVGEAAMLAEDYETAEEMLYGIEMYAAAFYAAWMMEADDKMAEDGACHLLYERKKVDGVVEMYLRLAQKAGDLSVFGSFAENEGDANPQLTGVCLGYLMACAGKNPAILGNDLSLAENRAEMFRIFRSCFPDPVPSQLEQMESEDDGEEADSAPVTFNSEQISENPGWENQPPARTGITGTIFSFKPEQKIGFIRAEDTDWFFHVNHITDEPLVQMLEEDPLGQYIVLFDVGYNSRGSCAVNVRLKDPEHPREKPDPALEVEHHGIITRYYPFYSNGQITEGDTAYNFRLAFVTDPTLKNYCEIWQNIVQYQFEVVFRLRKLKDGKLVATDIRLEHPEVVPDGNQDADNNGHPQPAVTEPAEQPVGEPVEQPVSAAADDEPAAEQPVGQADDGLVDEQSPVADDSEQPTVGQDETSQQVDEAVKEPAVVE